MSLPPQDGSSLICLASLTPSLRRRNNTSHTSRNIRIRFSTQFRLASQRRGRIELVHHDLHQLDLLRRSKVRIAQQLIQLLLRVHRVRLSLRRVGGALEDGEEGRPFPVGDVVVLALPAVQVSLDCVACIVEDEDDRLDARADHGRYFLYC